MKRWHNLVVLALSIAITALAIVVVWPGAPERYLPGFIPWPKGKGLKVGDFDRRAMRLGLDLRGGSYILLEADVAHIPPGVDIDAAMEGVKETIERRVNAFGVAETEIQRQGKYRLAVQIPGISPEEARELIGRTARLEFLEPKQADSTGLVCRSPEGEEFTVPTEGGLIFPDQEAGVVRCTGLEGQEGQLVLLPAVCREGCPADVRGVPLTGAFLKPNSRVEPDPQGRGFAVTLQFTGKGAAILSDVTRRLVGKPLAIALDGKVISAPVVQQELSSDAIISPMKLEEAKRLSVLLNSGALPVPMKVIQETQVDATLGDTSVRHAVQAALIGIGAVLFFMVAYYRLQGVIAALALIMYASLVLFIFKMWPVTLTLAGVAAFVLSVGMAVDANILIAERLKEELRAGRGLLAAIEMAVGRAWPSIRDSNVSTLITCGILWWFGDQFNAALVKGFALTLAIGVLVSMFTAMVITRTFMHVLAATPLARYLYLWGLSRRRPAEGQAHQPWNLVERRWLYFGISALVLLPGIVSLMVPPALKPGIEFTSGTTFTLRFEQQVDPEAVRSALADLGHPQARVQVSRDGDIIARIGELQGATNTPPVGPTPPSERDVLERELRQRFGPFQIMNFETVSATVSRAIVRNAAIAVTVAAMAILLYISWSFRHLPKPHRYGVAAVLALVHDTLFVVGAFSVLGKVMGMEVNTMFITGLLTVLGYSVHDTIVVFDRIRENARQHPEAPLTEVVNASVMETMVRSLNTSLTLLLTAIALLLLGGASIQTLVLVILLGTVTGTYSSIFVASQLLVAWEEGDLGKVWRRLMPRRPAPAQA
jgi:protein-export membrane protein SecD/preprotein translocase SecF subunit